MDPHVRKTKRRFDEWRRAHGGRARIPEWVWAEAVELASRHGVEQTAKTLEINASALEKRLRPSRNASDPSGQSFPGFVEVSVPPTAARSECTVEAEDSTGRRLKVRLCGEATSEAASVARALWEGQR